MRLIDKETMAMGAGCGIGVIQVVVFKEYADLNWGLFPVIGQYIPAPWNRWSTFGNILIGGIAFGISTFTNLISGRSEEINKFLQAYGITTLIGGIMNGIFPRTVMAAAALPIAKVELVPTGIPVTKVLA